MIKYFNQFTALFVAVFLLSACSSISIEHDWDTSVDFTKLKSFSLLENADKSINRLVDQRIRAAIADDLSNKGLEKLKTKKEADLAVAYTVTTEDRTSYQTVHSSMGAAHGFSHRGMRVGGSVRSSRTVQHNYTVGTLIIAIYQVNSKELIWEGTASGSINPSRNPEESEQLINNSVLRILENFPPKDKK